MSAVTTETTKVYRGGGRRWLSLKAACGAESRAMHKALFKSRCECDQPEYGDFGACYYPGNTCAYHQTEFYRRWTARVARMLFKGAQP